MIKHFYLTAVLLGFYFIGNAQWKQLPGYPANGNAASQAVINDTLIVASNGNAYDGQPGIYISADHGQTWSEKYTSLGVYAAPLVVNTGSLYAGTWGLGVNMSADKGSSWTPRNFGLPETFCVYDLIANNPDFYVCGIGGIFHSTDNTNSWENISYPGTDEAMSVVALGDTLISSFVTQTIPGVYKSIDNGADWTLINTATGLNDTYIRKFAWYFNRIFAVSGDLGTGNVYISANHGSSWIVAYGLNDQGQNYSYNFCAAGKTIFLATSNGVYKSSDYGLNWINTGCPNALSLAVIGDTLYAGTGYNGIWKRGLNEMAGSVEAIIDHRSFIVYPNPASDKIHIKLQQPSSILNGIISIYTIQNELVFQGPLNKDQTELDISKLAKGIYILKVTINKETETTKLVKL